MKISELVLSLAIALGVTSCSGTKPRPQTGDDAPFVPTASHPGSAAASAAGSGHKASVNRLEGDAPPADAEFTLFCDVVRGPTHVLTATRLKEDLAAKSGMTGFHIIHADDESMIFFGYYRTFNDKDHFPAEVARAQADLHRIEALKNAQGDRLFRGAMFLPINQPDPDAPPQWDLVRTPPTAYWSLQIAAYEGSPQRKKLAVEAVREARAQGIEAYYYHGETISSVCIGAWPRSAIKEQDSTDAKTSEQDAIPLVVSGPLPPNVSPEMTDKEGNRLVIEAPKLVVLDPTLAKAIRDYPEHAVNGDVFWRTAKNGQKIPSPSFIVMVPHSDEVPTPPIVLHNDAAASGANQATNDILDNPPAPSGTGLGHLRSIGQP